MNEEFILKIFWKNEKNVEPEKTRTTTIEFGVDILSRMGDLVEIIEKLLKAFPTICGKDIPAARLDNIKRCIDDQVRIFE